MFELVEYTMDELSESEQLAVATAVQPLVAQFSPRGESVRHVLEKIAVGNDPRVMVAKEDGVVKAFIDYKRFEHRTYNVWDLDGVVVDVEARSTGLFRILYGFMLAREKPDYVLLLTQNPRVYLTVAKAASYVLPHPEHGIMPATDAEMEMITARGKLAQTVKFPVIRDLYKHLLPVPDKSVNDSVVSDMFQRELGQHDTMVVLARM